MANRPPGIRRMSEFLRNSARISSSASLFFPARRISPSSPTADRDRDDRPFLSVEWDVASFDEPFQILQFFVGELFLSIGGKVGVFDLLPFDLDEEDVSRLQALFAHP